MHQEILLNKLSIVRIIDIYVCICIQIKKVCKNYRNYREFMPTCNQTVLHS